jgi:hypothetical protein
MNCREARVVLAALTHSLPAERRAEALAHVATCAACRARLDQFGAAIASGFDDEIPCAECRARLDAYVASGLGRQSPARAFPLVHAHLAACPECAEEYQMLVAGLVGLRDDSLVVPAALPRFDTRFAASRPPGSERRRAERAGSAGLAVVLRRWREALAGPGQWAARGALGAVAVLVLALFAGLVAYQPALLLRAQSLAPFNPSLRATAAAYIAATETVAAGGEQEDGGTPGGRQPGGSAGVGPTRRNTSTATPTLDPPDRTATAAAGAGAAVTRQSGERRARATARPRLLATATVTPTLALTVTLAAPTAPAREEPKREPERPAPTSEPPPEPPPEPPDDPYPPPSNKPSDPYP